MATVAHKLQEVHFPSKLTDTLYHISHHLTSRSLFNSLLHAVADSNVTYKRIEYLPLPSRIEGPSYLLEELTTFPDCSRY